VSITPVQPAREQSDEGSGAEGNRRSDRGHPNGRPQIYEKRAAAS
jgi:hypothetical protein